MASESVQPEGAGEGPKGRAGRQGSGVRQGALTLYTYDAAGGLVQVRTLEEEQAGRWRRRGTGGAPERKEARAGAEGSLAAGQRVTYTYDSAGRLLAQEPPDP